MALDGDVVKLDLPELKALVSLMRRSSSNLNQLTRKVHETGRVYDAFSFCRYPVFGLSVPDNMRRIRSAAKELKTEADL